MANEILDLLKSNPSDVLRRFESDLQHSTDYRKTSADKWYRYYRKYRGKHDEKFLQYRGDKFTIFVPLVFSLIENIIPRFVMGTFGTYPFINVVPVGEEDIESSKMAEKLLNTQLQNDRIIIKAPGWFKQFSMYGSSPAKIVWKHDVAKVPVGKSSRVVTRYRGPSFQPMDVMDLLVDPKATDEGIDSAGYLIHTIILSEEEMIARVQNAKKYDYKFPTDWEREGMSPSSEMWDKYQRERSLGLTQRESSDRKYWRFDEYWTKDVLITVMNKRQIVRRSPNGVLDYPFVNLNRNPLLGEFYGIGDIECVEDLMDEINYIRNLRLDNIDILTQGVFLEERSAAIAPGDLVARAGKTIKCNDINGVKQLVFQDITGPSRQEEGLLKMELQETSGIIDMQKGNLDRSNIPASGMAMLIEAASYRIKLGLLMIEHYGVRQIGEKFMRLNYLNLPSDYITRIVGEADWLKLQSPDEVFGNYDFVPSGSSEFLNKETLKQSVLQMYNLLARDPSVDQVGLKKLLAMSFGGRMLESVLLGKNLPPKEIEGGVEEPEPRENPTQDEGGVIQKENEQMLQGQEVPPVGDHPQHLPGHMTLMSDPQFAQLGPDIQGIFGRHVEGHKRAMSSGQGVALENPERFAADGGKGLEEQMKMTTQLPTRG